MSIDDDVEVLSACITPPRGVELAAVCTLDEWLNLCRRLLNDRPAWHYLRIYLQGGRVCKTTNKGENKHWDGHARWAFDTMKGTASASTSIGFYSQSFRTGMTCWGALDFDCHAEGGDSEGLSVQLYRRALQAFVHLSMQFPSSLVLLEESGRGYHVFLVMESPVSVTEMFNAMKDTCGCEGGIEIVPSPRITSYGKPLRAPGTWNPAVGKLSLLLGLSGPRRGSPCPNYWLAGLGDSLPERAFFLSLFFQATKARTWRSPDPSPDTPQIRQPEEIWHDFRGKYLIECANRRHSMMLNLVAEASYQYSRQVIMRFVELQYDSKSVPTEATREEHLVEAVIAHDGMVKQWLLQVSSREAGFHNSLRTECRMAALRILHNFAKYAADQGEAEFFIAQAHLAERLNVTRPACAKILKYFIDQEVILMSRIQTQFRARRYVWILDKIREKPPSP